MRHPHTTSRRGITLMEVLISIGILSIGLASVLALIPAGGHEARRALVADRKASLAANGLTDAINYGILDSSRWRTIPAGPAPYAIAVDPVGAAAFPPNVTPIVLGGLDASAAPAVFLGADDLAYEQPDDLDQPALPLYSGGQRVTTGAFSWLATLLPASGMTPDVYRLSIVTFHLRPVPPAIPGPFAVTGGARSVQLTSDLQLSIDDFRETFTRGSPILLWAPATTPVWRTIVAPLPQTSGTVVTGAELMLDSDVPFTPTMVYVYPGAVGIAEKLVSLEGVSPWSL
jgi:type II secretory pathway pseudopilin PulG